jgi:hypothetical protein
VSELLVPFAYAALVLVPGIGLWRLLRRGCAPDPGLDLAGAIAAGLALNGLLLLLAFAVHLPVWSIALAALAIGVAALAVAGPPPLVDAARTHVPFLLLGLAAGLAGWRMWTLSGDAPYHVGRVRRLLALDRLDLARMPELVDGSNHPGYYIPLPHAVVAETAWLTGASPTEAYRGSIIVLGLFATLLAGAVVFTLLHDRPLALAGAAIAVAAGLVGAREWSFVADPPSLATQVEWPALVLLAVAYWRERSRSALVGVLLLSGVLALTHVTYLPFALLVLGGAALGGVLRDRKLQLRPAVALAAAVGVPFVVYGLALLGAARGTAQRVGAGQRLADGIAKWERLDQIAHVSRFVVVHPRMLAGTGLLLVALAVVPLGGVLRRRETAWIAGGLAALVVCALVPPLPGALGRLVSVNQIRRLPFLEMPWLLVAVGAAGLVVLLRRQALVIAAVTGIVLGVAIPRHTTWETVAAILACTGSLGGLAWLLRRGVSLPVPATAWLAAAVLAAPWALAATPDLARAVADPPAAPSSLTPGAIAAVQALPKFTAIASDPQPSLLLTALTDALVYAVPPGNTADTAANHPTERVRDNRRILGIDTPRQRRRLMMRNRHIACLLVDRTVREPLVAELARERFVQRYADPRFALFCRR